MRRSPLFGCCALVALIATPALAQTAGMVGFQGFIRDSSGTPIITQVTLDFAIYDADTNGNLVDMNGDGIVNTNAAPPGGGTDVIRVGPLAPSGGIVNTKFGPVSPKAFAGCTAGPGGCRWLQVTVTDAFMNVSVLSRIEMVTPPGAAEQVNKPNQGTSVIVTDSSGNVGVGTSAPATKLDVRGGSVITDSVLGFSSPQVFTSPVGNYIFSPAANQMAFTTGGGERLRLDSSGNFGIGITAPPARLSVKSDGSVAGRIASFADALTNSAFIQVESVNGAGRFGTYGNNPAMMTQSGSRIFMYDANTDSMTFYTQDQPRLTLSAAGNVGIGVTIPSKALDVQGDARITGILDSDAGVRMKVKYTTTNFGNGSFAWTIPQSNTWIVVPGLSIDVSTNDIKTASYLDITYSTTLGGIAQNARTFLAVYINGIQLKDANNQDLEQFIEASTNQVHAAPSSGTFLVPADVGIHYLVEVRALTQASAPGDGSVYPGTLKVTVYPR